MEKLAATGIAAPSPEVSLAEQERQHIKVEIASRLLSEPQWQVLNEDTETESLQRRAEQAAADAFDVAQGLHRYGYYAADLVDGSQDYQDAVTVAHLLRTLGQEEGISAYDVERRAGELSAAEQRRLIVPLRVALGVFEETDMTEFSATKTTSYRAIGLTATKVVNGPTSISERGEWALAA